MKVLQVISSIETRVGGPIEGLIQQGHELVSLGHEVDTLSLDLPGTAIDPRMRVHAVNFLGPSFGKYAYAPKLLTWLRQRARNYDCIVIHGMWQYHGYCVAQVCREQDLSYVIFLHGMLDPWFNDRFPLKRLKKWLYWPWGEYRVLRDAKYVLFTTAEEMRLARRSFWLYRARERLVGYGIRSRSLEIGSMRELFFEHFPELKGKRIFLYLSRLHPKKGSDLLLAAFAEVANVDPTLHLVLAGPGDDGWVRRLKEQSETLRLSHRVTFPGMLTGNLKWGAYDAAEVFVLPSHQENFGIVLAEALSSALPVLTTRQVNIWRPIAESRAGLIEADTLDGTRLLLTGWLNMLSSERQQMRAAALACFNKNFEIALVVSNLERSLSEAAKDTNVPAHSFVGTFWNRVKPFDG